jgi:low temperature requirement protein LtrA
VTVAQLGWIALIFAHTSLVVTLALVVLLVGVEMLGPYLAERRTSGTPWHAHHISERYGLLAIIALGEGVVGTVATLSAVVQHQGWTADAILVALAGTGLTFGMWWVYFIVPSADVLHARRETSFWFGYLAIVLFGAIVATGAGLHIAAYYLEGHSELGSVATVLTVVVPVGAYVGTVYLLYALLLRSFDGLHVILLLLTVAVLVGAVLLAMSGISMAICLLVATAAPVVTVVGFEVAGHRHAAAALAARIETAG